MTAKHILLLLSLTAPFPSAHALAAQQGKSPRDSALHVLNRLAYGPTPGLVDQVIREGSLRWIDRQLGFEQLEDPALKDVLATYGILRASDQELLSNYLRLQQEQRLVRREPGDSGMDPAQRQRMLSPEARELRGYNGQLVSLVLVRATASSHQLGEVMADFWSNHFNIFIGKNLDRVYLPSYIEQTIRPHAMGRFQDLLLATARSPAMMIYLDNAQSVAPGSQPPPPPGPGRFGGIPGRPGLGVRPGAGGFGRRLPPGQGDSLRRLAEARRPTGINENYARELLELHTLGVDGGYTQRDVTEVARILTGWSVVPPQRGAGFSFNDWAHDRGAKTVMGIEFPAGQGEGEGVRLLQLLASHPSTMHHISAQLCARFVSDTPPDGCIDDAVAAWKRSDGEIREVLRAIFHSPDFWAAANVGSKVKSPLEFVASAVRAVGAAPDSTPRLALAVARLGEPLYQHVAPNGYGERQEDWVNSGALLNRMNVAMALAANRLPGVRVDLDAVLPVRESHEELVNAVDRLVLGGKMSRQTHRVILEQLAEISDPAQARALAVGLALGGPEFQKQ